MEGKKWVFISHHNYILLLLLLFFCCMHLLSLSVYSLLYVYVHPPLGLPSYRCYLIEILAGQIAS